MLLRFVLGGTLLAAAFFKIQTVMVEPAAETVISRSLGSSVWIPLGLAVVEVMLSGALLFLKSLIGPVLTAAFLSIGTAMILRDHLAHTAAAPCGCLPASLGGGSFSVAMIRNIAMLACCAWLLSAPNTGLGRAKPRLGDSPPVSTRGFTVVELIVVVGVIALLLTLVLSVTSLVRERSRSVQCLSNLRQIGVAFSEYGVQHRGFTPRGGYYAGQPGAVATMWLEALPPYLGVPDDWDWPDLKRLPVLHCPAFLTADVPSSYAVNSFDMTSAPNWQEKGETQLSRVRMSSSVVLLVDTTDSYGKSDAGLSLYDDVYFEHMHTIFKPRHLEDAEFARIDLRRHGKAGNALFFDFHAETIPSGGLPVERFDDGVGAR